jgi:chemotaxis protein CheD
VLCKIKESQRGMSVVIKVGMADMAVCSGDDAVTTLGLGSCIGIAIRDPGTGIGGLVHIMLPDSTEIKNNTNRPKFADTGIEDLVSELVKKGANRSRLVAKIAGGAQMFSVTNKNDTIRVGERNALASKKKLSELKIPLLAEDTGDTYGRTVVFYPKTGDYVIKAIGKPEKTI